MALVAGSARHGPALADRGRLGPVARSATSRTARSMPSELTSRSSPSSAAAAGAASSARSRWPPSSRRSPSAHGAGRLERRRRSRCSSNWHAAEPGQRASSGSCPRRPASNCCKTLVAVAAIVVAWRGRRAACSADVDALAAGCVSPADAAGVGVGARRGLLWQARPDRLLGARRRRLRPAALAQLRKSLKMTKQEVKDEHKMTKATPRSRARVRRVQREMVAPPDARRGAEGHRRHHQPDPLRGGARVPARRDGARRVVRRQGRRTMSPQRIRTIAREHGVPIVENMPLARRSTRRPRSASRFPAPLFERWPKCWRT